jgi:lipid II:glycine glycyltransferase (peptidoglycan interpeptide bridge formation enzyme)
LSEKIYFKKFVAKYQSEIISCRFVLCYKKVVYDWFAGTDESHLDKYPNDFLPWKIIQWSKENNYMTFDFGGAGRPEEPYGVREYKLKFGGKLVDNGRFVCIHNKFLFLIGHFGLKLFKLLR